MPELDLKSILMAVHQQYGLNWQGPHGVRHWARVMHNGLLIADVCGADPDVIRLFALFHDACRWNEHHDPRHGDRGAELAISSRGTFFELDDTKMELLVDACRRHNYGETDADITVQACWDADRLDLQRVGMTPNPKYLCTAYAKQSEVIQAACVRAVVNEHPHCMPQLQDLP